MYFLWENELKSREKDEPCCMHTQKYFILKHYPPVHLIMHYSYFNWWYSDAAFIFAEKYLLMRKSDLNHLS